MFRNQHLRAAARDVNAIDTVNQLRVDLASEALRLLGSQAGRSPASVSCGTAWCASSRVLHQRLSVPDYPTNRVEGAQNQSALGVLQGRRRCSSGVLYDLGYGSLGGVSSYFPYSAVKVVSPSPTPCPSGSVRLCFPLSPQNAAPPTITANPPVSDIVVAKPDLKLPRTYEWNVALEQSVGKSQSLSLTYIGAIGRGLPIDKCALNRSRKEGFGKRVLR
jgi:hypothetical protein